MEKGQREAVISAETHGEAQVLFSTVFQKG
jgi:hypothetical protein